MYLWYSYFFLSHDVWLHSLPWSNDDTSSELLLSHFFLRHKHWIIKQRSHRQNKVKKFDDLRRGEPRECGLLGFGNRHTCGEFAKCYFGSGDWPDELNIRSRSMLQDIHKTYSIHLSKVLEKWIIYPLIKSFYSINKYQLWITSSTALLTGKNEEQWRAIQSQPYP